jgi:hypothetical protein
VGWGGVGCVVLHPPLHGIWYKSVQLSAAQRGRRRALQLEHAGIPLDPLGPDPGTNPGKVGQARRRALLLFLSRANISPSSCNILHTNPPVSYDPTHLFNGVHTSLLFDFFYTDHGMAARAAAHAAPGTCPNGICPLSPLVSTRSAGTIFLAAKTSWHRAPATLLVTNPTVSIDDFFDLSARTS